jgi:hypothetical protein
VVSVWFSTFHGACMALPQQRVSRGVLTDVHTSFTGRVMGLPDGLPTGFAWPATRPAKRETMAILENMLTIVGIM